MTVNKIILETINQVQQVQNLRGIFQSFKTEIQGHIIQTMSYSSKQLKRKYHLLCKKYVQTANFAEGLEWIENQKKIFISLLLVFCYLNLKKISQITESQWTLFSEAFNNKSILLLKYELHSIQRKHLRVTWNKFQQSLLHQYVQSHSDIDWNDVSHFIYFHSSGKYFKTGKQCRQHWFNHLDNKIVKGSWSVSEDLVILEAVLQKGKKWAQMVSLLQNKRTEHMIKNRFNSLITCGKKIIKTNSENLNQNEIIVFMKQKLGNRRQALKTRYRHRKQIEIKNQEDKVMNLSYNIEHLSQFHPSNNSNHETIKLQLQPNQLKLQFCDSAPRQQNFRNVAHNDMQQKADKIKIEHMENTDRSEKSQENVNMTVTSNINLGQTINLVGFHPNQLYVGQTYSYYYPTLFYPLI